MAIESIVARTYDLGQEGSQKLSEPSVGEFQDVVDKLLVTEENPEAQQCSCELNKTSTTEDNVDVIDELSDENSVIADAVAFSFSMFVSISGDFEQAGQEIGKQFNMITSKFMHGLQGRGQGSPKHVDAYLKNAEEAVDGGQSKIGTFFEQMQAKRQYTLQSMVDPQTDQSFMSNVNLSTSSALPGTSGADIARIYLDAAAEGQNPQDGIYEMSDTENSNSSLSRYSYGLKMVSASSSSLVVETPKEVASEQTDPGFMDKFLGLMDSFMGNKNGEFMDRAVIHPSIVSVEFGFDIHRYSAGLFNTTSKTSEEVNSDTIEQDSVENVEKIAV